MPFGGFLYAVYFICIGLPQALAAAGGEGYIRINGDLENGEPCGECSETPSEASQPSAPAMAPSQPRYSDAPGGLPSYEEVEGSSNGTRAPVDTKFGGDNKVQQDN